MTGTIASKVIEHFIGSPLQARRDAWFTDLGGRIAGLLEKGVLTEADLAGNEEFVSVVADATAAAMRTHHEAKREALANAAINTAIGVTMDEVVRASFMAYIERYSPLHLEVLRILANPGAHERMSAAAKKVYIGSSVTVLIEALNGPTEDVVARVLRDLDSDGLTNGSAMGAMATGGSMLDKRTSSIGDAFLRFISTPA
ncbi:hypothetical protein [Chenggangzhangella methanolivorans]|uniref:Uncharacterized protein n=2 Tax=Chenggangzhangella methanolivorans TaxID=1437009 RepID=A0A9E6R5F8_9HYPH|nr:hypothetical protein [Chenggangzhangella methanolivorans]QZN98555.1 hypothetical protein K6K41_16085 [Chenggangzhangella methanolivorans]